MHSKPIVLLFVLLLLGVAYGRNSPRIRYALTHLGNSAVTNKKSVKNKPQKVKKLRTREFAGNCYDINWATWTSFSDVKTTTGSIIDADGTSIGITMSANYKFGSTPSIYTYARFSTYPATIPNSTVPKTTWAAGAGGSTEMCFSRPVTNPVLLLSSLGSSLPQSATLDFSIPYVVLYDGGGMVYNNSTKLTGTEGYAIIMFPGEFTCVTINSSTPENYTNLTWGIRPQPFTVNVIENSAICGSTTVTASGGTTYQWDGGDTPEKATNTFHQSGTYLVTVTNAAGCVTSASKAVTVRNLITPTISSFTIPQQLNATVIDEANKTITLTMPAGTNLAALQPVIAVSGGGIAVPSSGATQNFTNPVLYSVTNTCSSEIYKVTVVIEKQVTTCSGSANILTGDTPAPAGTYTWQTFEGNSWVNAPGTFNTANYQTAALTNTIAANSIFKIRRQVTVGANVTTDSYYQLTAQLTTAITNNKANAPAVISFCDSGDPALITGSIPNGGTGTFTYQWQASADNITFNNITDATAKDFDPTVLTASTYYRRTATSGICTLPVVSNVVTIIILGTPLNAVLTPVSPICAGSVAALSVKSPIAGLSYNWYDSAAKNNLLFSGPTYITGPLTTNKNYFVEVSNGTCTNARLANIAVLVVNPPPAPTLALIPSSICQGATATLNVSSPQGALKYNWYTSAAGVTPAFTGTQFNTTATAANVAYYVEAVNASGCASARTAANISATAAPSITTQGAIVCPGTGTTLTATSTDNNVTTRWYSSMTGGISVYTGASFPTPVINTATTYYAEAINNANGCVSVTRAAAAIQIRTPLPAPSVAADVIKETSVSFKWAAVPGATGYQISTDNGQTFNSPSSGPAGLSHVVTGLTNGKGATIIVRASGLSGCELSGTSVAVTAIAINPFADQIYVANAFTPNGDGNNDVVYVHSENITTVKFYVYDQWGELLFASTSKQGGWDGTYKGQPEPAGVYVYYVQAVMTDGKQVNKKGTITLIR
ncbi:hypothetical protein A0256_02740 [Mucilaginibacter sp. PAMC 26640]|nr:hypothetical protein A0256_02740 [Mucilaginibacter sp. PAMC 26640]